jgi:hypothetical protein
MSKALIYKVENLIGAPRFRETFAKSRKPLRGLEDVITYGLLGLESRMQQK